MQEEMLKTTWRQRIIILVIAAVLLLSSIAVYIAVVLSGSLSKSSSSDLDAITKEYNDKETEIANLLSNEYLEQLKSYKSEVAAYNENSANDGGLQYEDIVVGEGAEINGDNNNYYAYYIGWCADESVFDSSFDNIDNPTSLKAPLSVGTISLIDGWTQGMAGAKVGGVRKITIPGELAYGDTTEICGGYNKPLKFLVMTVTISDEAQKLYTELDEIYQRYINAYYEKYAAEQSAAAGDDGEDSDDDEEDDDGTDTTVEVEKAE